MRIATKLFAAAILATSVAAFADTEHDHDQDGHSHDAHVHGLIEVEIATDGEVIVMGLKAPGNDIVGFEHKANSADDLADIQAAISSLANPANIVSFGAAGCYSLGSEAKFSEESEHSGFEARYYFRCLNSGDLEEVEFLAFESFEHAKAIEVTVVDQNGARNYTADRDHPIVHLKD